MVVRRTKFRSAAKYKLWRCPKVAFQSPVTPNPKFLIPRYSSLLSSSGFAALYMCSEAATTTLNLEP